MDLNSILTEIAARIRRLTGDKLVVRTQLDPNLARVKADPKQMDWLFVNLAADAYDGMQGGGELVITSANVELNRGTAREMNLPPGQYVRVEISAERGNWEVGPMVRNIIRQIQGAVAVKGIRPGVMDVILPQASEAGAAVMERQQRLDQSGQIVLFVSSDSSARALTSDLLKQAGYRVLEAADGVEADSVLAAGEVDLMITDIVMPEQDALETILSVRAIYPGLKIIAIAEIEARHQSRSAKLFGADSVVSKPLMRSSLCDAVREQIGG